MVHCRKQGAINYVNRKKKKKKKEKKTDSVCNREERERETDK